MSDLHIEDPTPRQVVIERRNRIWNKYLWLKTVTAVNLAVHCYSSLIGQPLHVHNQARRQTVYLPEAPAYYLCGVTEPYRWKSNSHVLMLPGDPADDPVSVTTPSLRVTMTGLRPVEIDPDWLEDVYGGQDAFTTCRNLQAAWMLHRDHGFENFPGRTPKLARQQQEKATRWRPDR
jgi:hypothetical protein